MPAQSRCQRATERNLCKKIEKKHALRNATHRSCTPDVEYSWKECRGLNNVRRTLKLSSKQE